MRYGSAVGYEEVEDAGKELSDDEKEVLSTEESELVAESEDEFEEALDEAKPVQEPRQNSRTAAIAKTVFFFSICALNITEYVRQEKIIDVIHYVSGSIKPVV